MSTLSKMFWGTLFTVVIKSWVGIFRDVFKLIGSIFNGIFYLIGLLWSALFSKKGKKVESKSSSYYHESDYEQPALQMYEEEVNTYYEEETRQRREYTKEENSIVTVSNNTTLITCTGCGEQYPRSSMRKCHTCGIILCPSCRKNHTCCEEQIECVGCGGKYPKSTMRKCHACGDVLCPSCRKHHVCGSRKKESVNTFHEYEAQKLILDIMESDDLFESPLVLSNLETPHEDADEWFRKGQMYFDGNGVEKDLDQAIHWYTKASDADYTKAQFALGLSLLTRRNLGDFDKASYWLRIVDEKGGVPTEMIPTIAEAFQEGSYYKESFDWYTKGAERGVAEAQYKLGLHYIADIVVTPDYKKAAHWFEKADKQGYTDAHERYGYSLYAIGNSYFHGWNNCSKDEREAVKWYKKSALSGYAGGQRMLGCCYLQGKGVLKNYETGFLLVKEAAEASNPADEGAFSVLGICYLEGIGVQQDLDKARYWLQKSIDADINLDVAKEMAERYPMLRLSF